MAKQDTWAGLNEVITDITSEQLLQEMIDDEIQGKCRPRHVFRIHSRLNKVRAVKERKNLQARIDKKNS